MTAATLCAEHIAEVACIERMCFSEPWSEQGLLLFTGADGMGAVCLDEAGHVAAYACMTAVLDEGEIVTVATHPQHRRHGCAHLALERLCGMAAERGIVTLTLEVRASNSAARALYEQLGFCAVGCRRGFYSFPREDAIIMQKIDRG